MTAPITFTTRSETLPTLVAAGVFLLPGLGAVIFGALTGAGLTWVPNPANGILVGVTGTIWAIVGFGILRFRRWITVDPGEGQVVRGTRSLFTHPGERFDLERFRAVEVRTEVVGDHTFYAVVFLFTPEAARARREQGLWLDTAATADEARQAAERVAQATGRPLFDRTRGEAG